VAICGILATCRCCARGHEAYNLWQAGLDALSPLVSVVELLVLGDRLEDLEA
jgi:hypothetical protein